jgi:hypothetical protein
MRFTHVAAVFGTAFVALPIAPVVLIEAPSAHADLSGYRRCVGAIKELPLSEPDPQSSQRAGLIEQDLKSGISPAAEAQKVAQMGFDQNTAGAIVQCVIEENP